jgi:outer membrane protein
LDYAKKNRAEYVSYRRRKIEAERDLEQAKKQNFSVNLTGALGFNNIGNTFYDIYQNPHQQQSASIGVQIPVLDWGRRREKQKLALSNLKTVEYSIEQEEQALNSQIINLIQNLELIKSNISTAKLASEISLERFELSQEQIRLGKLSVTDLNISLNEKDEAKRAYITSLRSFWDSYFQLRTLTLFDDKL